MELKKIQNTTWAFDQERGWDRFPSSLVFVHLVEELGELGKHILFNEGYKTSGYGHNDPDKDGLNHEFAQVFILFLQLASKNHVDLEAVTEAEIDLMKTRFDPEKWMAYMKNWKPE